jgi:hypothetical protein
MSFDLKLTFTGMMLYVPEASQLQVLMPKTADTLGASSSGGCGTETAGCVENHAARITFDTAYSREGALALDDAVAHVSMRLKRLEVPAVGSAYVRGIPSDIVTAASPVRDEVLDGSDNGDLTSRVKVSTGEATYADPGACWEYDGTIRRMSHQVEWTIADITGDYLDLPLMDLDGLGAQGSLPRLYPIAGVIELWVWHAPSYELPPDAIAPETPADGDEGHHFSHLRMLLDSRSIEMPLFRPEQCGELPPCTRPRHRDKGASSLTCTGAQAPVVP